MRFRGGASDGKPIRLDGAGEAGPSPVDTLLVALASCSAIDVVEILNKRRSPPVELGVRVEFARAADPPRRVTEARVHFRIDTAAERSHVERAIELSFEKYCSVSASLAPDTHLSWELELWNSKAGSR